MATKQPVKRGDGEGQIRQRANGTFEARIRFEDPLTGEHVRKSFYGKTKTEVRTKMRDAIRRIEAGQPATDANTTVGAWAERWITTALAASPRRDSTKTLYTTLLRKHVIPAEIGTIRLDRLRPTHIDTYLLELHQGPLSDATAQRIFQVLRVCLDDAVRDGLLGTNPLHRVKQPRRDTKEARNLTTEELSRLFAEIAGTRWEPFFVTIAGTGLRKGEALALKWSDVDLDAGTLKVSGTLQRLGGALVVSEPKTAKSRRVIVPSDRVMTALRNQRKMQLTERLAAGSVWADSGHVFTTEHGSPIDPRNALRALQTAADRAGVEGVTVHSLRHTAATAMLDAGVHLPAVSELLGHAQTQITADTYAHLTNATARRAMDILGEALG